MKLKFRAWSKDLNHYFYNVAVYPNNIAAIQRHNVESMMLKSEYGATHWTELDENAVIEQFTGLYDKNDKEIYEGDIIKRYLFGLENFNGEDCRQYATYEVRWESDECCFALHYLYGYRIGDGLLSNNEQENYEIIGNIHKNPELLEKE